jgi:putative SOS response-associated peptidase YedK
MCGRTRLTVPFAVLAKLYRLEQADVPNVVPRLNLAPTEPIPIVRCAPDGKRRLDLVRWGLIPRWADSPSVGTKMFNARIETVATKPAFRDALPHRRCLVLADAFYEWKPEGKRKVPHAVRSPDGAPLAMAGLWDVWKSADGEVIESCTVITRDAAGEVAALHDRMPVVLPAEAQDRWLGSGERDRAALVAFIKDAARRDFTIEALDSMPVDAPPRQAPQLKLFG